MKKYKLVTSVLAAIAIAIGATAAYAEPSNKQKPTFFCGNQHGVPTIFARTRRVNVPILRPVTRSFNSLGWSPQKRCEEVSARFQRYYENGTFNYITTGTINRQPVVCGTNSIGGSCSTTGLLFTLRPTDDPNLILQELFEFRDYGSSPLLHSTESSEVYDEDGKLYINLEEFLWRRAVVDPDQLERRW